MTVAARTFGHAAYLSVFEFFDRYTPREWVIAWLPRVVLQLAFFYGVASFVGGSDLRAFLLIGNATQTSVHALMVFATQAVGRELSGGTMVLLLATPARVIAALLGRGLAEVGNGLLSSAIALAVALMVLGVPLDPLRLLGAAGVLLSIAASTYGLAMLLGSVMLRFPQYQNAASNLVGISTAVLCGVNVPVSYLPAPVQVVSNALPLTHGLAALRAILGGAEPDIVLGALALELAVGTGYVLLARLSFAHFLARARARGTLDFH